MKVCITATGNNLEAQTDQSFGRTPWLIIIDTDTLEFEAIENEGVNATQGAGIAAAQLIRNKGAQALFTGRVGPKARAALDTAGIAIHEGIAACSVRDAVDHFRNSLMTGSGAAVTGSTPVSPDRPGSGSGGQGQGSFGGGGRGLGGGGKGLGGGGGRCRSNTGSGKKGGR